MKRMSYGAIGVCLAGVMFAGPGRAKAGIVGFDNGTGFTVNNSGFNATMSGGVLTLTNNHAGEAHTVFYNTPQDDRIIFANFTYQASGAKAGEGTAFVLQNNSTPPPTNALGFGGAGLGYVGIAPSFALEVNINSANTVGIAFGKNGSIGPYTAPGAINLASGDRIYFNLLYNGSTMTATLTDIDNSSIPSFITSTAVDLPTLLGSTTAFVGFAGATSTLTSTQTISNFAYANVPEPSSIIMAFTSCVAGFCAWSLARRKGAVA